MSTVQEKIKGLLLNYPVKGVQFGYNEITVVLNGGHEIVINSETSGFDGSVLTVEHYVIERKQLDRLELD